MLNDLVKVLTRFRTERYACMADLSKCFFQVSVPENQRDLLRLVWYKNNNLDEGKTQVFQFTRYVWSINSSPYIALPAIDRLVSENCTNASHVTLEAVENNRYMDDLLLSADSIDELTITSREAKSLFQSRGFKLLKWVANSCSKSVLSGVPPSDLGSSLREVDLGTQPMPEYKALGLVWDVEDDKLRVSSRQPLGSVSTRREMLRALASQFDPLGFLAPWLLGGKLILHNATKLGYDWDDYLFTVFMFNVIKSFSQDNMKYTEGDRTTVLIL